MTIKAINNIIRYNNLVSILLILKIFSRIINDDILTSFIIKRVKVINIVTNRKDIIYNISHEIFYFNRFLYYNII